MRPHWLTAILMVLIAAPLFDREAAGARISLPLEGFYRPGRSMPVRIDEPGKSVISLSAELAVPSDISAGWTGVAPLFVFGAFRESELLVHEPGDAPMRFTLHALQPNERLVALVAGDDSVARSIFPGFAVITVRLAPDFDPLKLLATFQSVDAIVLRDVAPQDLPRYLEAGIAVAAISRGRPDASLPWERVGDCWVLQMPQTGPDSIVGGEDAYIPTQGWRQAASSRLRFRIVLGGVIAALCLLGCLLLPGARIRVAAVLMVSALSCVAILFWRSATPALNSISGNIVVASDGLVRTDHWEYLAAGLDGSGPLYYRDQPVVYDSNHARAMDLRQQVQLDGSSRWSFAIPPHGKLAILRRRIEVGTVPAMMSGRTDSPLELLARQVYLRPGFKVAGELRSPRSEWGTTVIVPD